jgi:predicted transcriptional regulator
MSLEEKVLAFVKKHPGGVKISEMEEPLGETRMKLGYTAKALLNEGKVQKLDNIYFPVK